MYDFRPTLGRSLSRPDLREVFNVIFPGGGEGASGLNVLALSERALRALPDVVNFSSLGHKPARPEIRECFNLIFSGGGGGDCVWGPILGI